MHAGTAAQGAKLRIAPIGTCRVHHPLRSGLDRYPISLELGRNYGFVHTTAEAIQQLRFMLEGAPVPSSISRLVCRPSIPENFGDRLHKRADLYLIEVSSKKLITIDQHPLQINYVQRYFSDFFADKARTRWYWQMANTEQLRERHQLLKNDRVFKRLSDTDQELLATMIRRDQTDGEIERQILEISDYIGRDRIAFVTHVDAMTPDNTPLAHRHSLIQLVRDTCQSAGVPCYDPTGMMREFGQMKAMQNDGLDLTHYTEAFSARLCEDFNRLLFAPRIAAILGEAVLPVDMEPNDNSVTALEAAWNNGRRLEASRQLHELLRQAPMLHEHRMLLGRMQFELGDYENAVKALEMARNEIGPNEKTDQVLMQAHFYLGNHQDARRYAIALLSDEHETVEIVRISAITASALADTDAALTDWKWLFRIADEKDEAAGAVLKILCESQEQSIAAEWAEEVLEALPNHGPSFDYLWRRHVELADRMGLLALAQRPVNLDARTVLALADLAANANMATPAALLVAAYGSPQTGGQMVAEWIGERASDWLAEGQARLLAGDLVGAADALQARGRLRPTGNLLIRARRTLEQKSRHKVRELFLANDHQGVIALIESLQATQLELPEMESFLGRSADALGDYQRALKHLKLAAEEEGSPISSLIHLARVAARSHNYAEAFAANLRVIEHQPQETWAIDEAQRQLGALAIKAVRAARQCILEDQLDEAWSLLKPVLESNLEHPLAEREQARILRAHRLHLKSLDASNNAKRLATAEAILRITPDDEAGLRAGAIGAMRLHQFSKALGYWLRIRPLATDTSQIDVNIQKCQLWIERAKANSSTHVTAQDQSYEAVKKLRLNKPAHLEEDVPPAHLEEDVPAEAGDWRGSTMSSPPSERALNNA